MCEYREGYQGVLDLLKSHSMLLSSILVSPIPVRTHL